MQIGRKIYYEYSTGNIILDTGERQGDVVETTQEQDFVLYTALSKYQPSAVGVLQLDFGQDAQNFATYPYHIDISQNPAAIVWDTANPTGATLADIQAAKIAQINDFAGQRIDGGFYSYAEGKTDSTGAPVALLYKSDSDHREQLGLLNNLVQFHTQGLFTDIKPTWKDASQENEPCHLITDDMAVQLFAEMGQHVLWCKITSDALVAEITAATAIADVNAVTFPDEPVPAVPAVPATDGGTQ